jgi:hypothetical protein
MGRREQPMRIDERVRAAHLEHFCPGGLGLPVTTSRPVGLSLEGAAPMVPGGNAARAVGQQCGRCGRLVALGQDARRRVGGICARELSDRDRDPVPSGRSWGNGVPCVTARRGRRRLLHQRAARQERLLPRVCVLWHWPGRQA